MKLTTLILAGLLVFAPHSADAFVSIPVPELPRLQGIDNIDPKSLRCFYLGKCE